MNEGEQREGGGDPTEMQLREIERWNNLKKSQAEKKIMAHLLFSGGKKEENDKKARLRKRKKQKKTEKKQELTKNSVAKEFDIESIVRSIEGGSYKQPKKSNKKKKKKRKSKRSQTSNQSQVTTPVPVKQKTEEQRRYRKIVASDRRVKTLTCQIREGLTVIGRTDRRGFRIPELNIQFECTSLDGCEQHIFLSNIDKQYALPYCADNCEFISCPEAHFDQLVSVVQTWRELQNGSAIKNEPSPQEGGMSPSEVDEEEEEVAAADGEVEEDDLVWQSFLPGSCLEYPEVGGYVHAYESSDNCLAYCFSKDSDPKQYSLVYINQFSSSFKSTLHSLSKSDIVFIPCSISDEPSLNEIPFKQLQTFIQSNPSTTFLLFFPSLQDPQEAFSVCDDIIHKTSLDMSNTILFLPFHESSDDILVEETTNDIEADGVEAEV